MEPKKIKEILDREEKKGREELAALQTAHYTSKLDDNLPENFMQLFKKSVFKMSPKGHNVPMTILKDWVEKPDDELTIGQIGKMIDFITSVPMETLFESFDSAIEYLRPLEILAEKLRASNQIFEEEMEKKENSLKEKLHKKQMSLVNAPGQVKPQKSTIKKSTPLAVAQ